MRTRAPSTRPWTLGAVFAFIAAALVAVFGITPAHAAGPARHVAGPGPVETLAAPWVTPAGETTVAVAAADDGEDHAHAQTAAVAPVPVRTDGPAVRFVVPSPPDGRAGSLATSESWGRAPPA